MGPRVSAKAAMVLLLAAAAEAFYPVRVLFMFPRALFHPTSSTVDFSTSAVVALALLLNP